MRAVIAQSDVVTAYGWGLDSLWNGLMSGRTAVTAKNPFCGDKPGSPLGMVSGLELPAGTSRVKAMLNRLLAPLKGKLDPNTPLILATTVGEIEAIEQSVLRGDPKLAEKASPQLLMEAIQAQVQLHGPTMVMSSACASSSAALSRAAAMVEDGEPAVLLVTADAVSEFVYAGFATLLSLCETSAKPFDANHCGLSLGEGAAWVLVTREDSPLATRDSPIILGWSSTADAVHMTAPDRTAAGLSHAITTACGMAKIDPKQVGLIAAHGTATLYNDTMEMLAFRNTISEPRPLFSIKGGTGHTLAAAGLMQILVGCRAMQLKTVPPTVGLEIPDESARGWVHAKPLQLNDPSILLSTNSGFGGVNTAVILGQLNSPGRKTGDRPLIRVARNDPRLSGQGHQNATNEEIAALLGASPKYLPRMTQEARAILVSAALSMKALGWNRASHIGIVGSGYDGWLAANRAYYLDYIAQGRTMGRANLFIYTLPTSALSEVAIALGLTGPTLHVSSKRAALDQATAIVTRGEATQMLCIVDDVDGPVCMRIGPEGPDIAI